MSATLLATVSRGKILESFHRGDIAVADPEGGLPWASAGLDGEQRFYFRSSAKPIQALSLVESGAADAFRMTAREIALACASHSGEPRHVAAVARLLERAGLKPDQLRCGVHPPTNEKAAAALVQAGRKATCLCHNCSGKHTGMLLACLHRGWPLESYTDRRHPLQREILRNIAEFCGVKIGEVGIGKDGCNLPAHAVPLRGMATAYARLASPGYWLAQGRPGRAKAVERITSAMRSFPFMMSGTDRPDNLLMTAARGKLFCKGGAEAVWCAGFPGTERGIAFKIADGGRRADTVVMAEILRQTKLLDRSSLKRFAGGPTETIKSSDGSAVGEIRPAFRLVRV